MNHSCSVKQKQSLLIQYLNKCPKPLWRDKHNCTVDYLLHPPIYLASRGYGEVTYEKLNK